MKRGLVGVVAALWGWGLGAAELPHDAYVWQRAWRGTVQAALQQSASEVHAWRVLYGTWAAGDPQPRRVALDAQALLAAQRPVVAVVRIERGVSWAQAPQKVRALLASWPSGVPLAGVEIDHDSSVRQLGDYAFFLRRLKDELAREPHSMAGSTVMRTVPLSVTLLPDWLGEDALKRVLASVDESVLQLHGVGLQKTERGGLFSRESAQAWVQRMAAYGRPFWVALPNYGVRVSLDARQQVQGVLAEVPLQLPPGEQFDYFADPTEVAHTLQAWRVQRPAGLKGVVWFRLPVETDVRTWGRPTWHAVMRGEPLRLQWSVNWRALSASMHQKRPHQEAPQDASSTGGLWQDGEVWLHNAGAIDALWPAQLRINRLCVRLATDWMLENALSWGDPPVTTLERTTRVLMRSGAARPIARLRCRVGAQDGAAPPQVTVW